MAYLFIVNIHLWRDKINGNWYNRAQVTVVNEGLDTVSFITEKSYGDREIAALHVLKGLLARKLLPEGTTGIEQFCRENNWPGPIVFLTIHPKEADLEAIDA